MFPCSFLSFADSLASPVYALAVLYAFPCPIAPAARSSNAPTHSFGTPTRPSTHRLYFSSQSTHEHVSVPCGKCIPSI
ncbi:hypothetical protein PLICRDRAFT_340972 [Plicaturopsis crispa FD-325 SS-3]|uniref:Secreted protein n=1 Tax=Plicaturopsis crispa FD-325 SS-3 TaxID=944288 RepID=A0A0C9SY37_PLICR|nr:hypothetical protein PLICRDRAFT_340972 [Plicaturopsis crispa FD-325 SS-3]